MYKVIVVEDETMVRRGIILTIDWAALDCVIAGEAANGEEGAELAVPVPGYNCDGCEDAQNGRRGDDNKTAGTGLPGQIHYFDGLQRF